MLYWLEHENTHQYCYAYEDKSLEGFSHAVCPQCGRTITTPQFKGSIPHLLLEGGKEYPDFLQFCGAGRQLHVVSERTLDLYEKNHVSGYSGYCLITVENENPALAMHLCPRYYCLDITGKIEIDFAAMHLKKKRICSLCGQFEWNRMRMNPFVLNNTTWDGADLCRVDSFRGFKVCSDRVRYLTENNKLFGALFRMAL